MENIELKRYIEKEVIEELTSRGLLWEFYDKFDKYKKRNDDEMFEFHGLDKESTGLPVNVFVDDSGSYKMRNHPLWIYFQNDYAEHWANKEYLPISVSRSPKLLTNKKLKISRSDLQKVFEFIKINKLILKKLADHKMSQDDFWWQLDTNRLTLEESFNKSNVLLNEMAEIPTSKSGLPVPVWVDEGTSPQHDKNRMKFKAVKNTYPRNFSCIRFEDLSVLNLPKNFPKDAEVTPEDIELLKKFVIYNKDNLIELGKGGDYKFKTHFLRDMVTMGPNGIPIYPQQQKVPNSSYKQVRKPQFGLTMVMSNPENKYNFVNNKRVPISKTWFDQAEDFLKYNDGTIAAKVVVDNKWHWLYTNGKTNPIN